MKRDSLLEHDSSFVDKAPAVALKETARVASKVVNEAASQWRYAAPR